MAGRWGLGVNGFFIPLSGACTANQDAVGELVHRFVGAPHIAVVASAKARGAEGVFDMQAEVVRRRGTGIDLVGVGEKAAGGRNGGFASWFSGWW
ncbi:MAG: hypothetical protein IT424_07725 [Pirellulales bacterium]|nr:hypothetical protein [Pirellulales bacterium]